jgi:subtilase family serine protease
MARVDRSRPSVRLRPSLSLERLEDRQLLSAVPIGSLPVLPPVQPDIQSQDILPLTTPAPPTAFYTPSQVRTAYGLTSIPDQGQGMTVAIVDAYQQPFIQSDVNEFSSLLGLPLMDGLNGDPTLSIKVPTGQTAPGNPPSGTNWGIEISLDVEWVHSVAPFANIDLITCQNSSGDSLFGAEVDGQPYASGVVYAKSLPGVVVVSNSYGSGEFNGETNYDSQFTTPSNNVAFVFSSGDDSAPALYPAFSPNVVAVGGTSLYTKSIKGGYGSESGWSGSGGGVSKYEPVPSYQSSNGVNFGNRSAPDVSWLADPDTGVVVIDSLDAPGELIIVGGTSLAAPMTAGLIAMGDQARGSAGSLSSTGVLNSLYGAYNSGSYSTDFHDITTGNNGFAAGPGYDLVTGIGTPKAPAIVSLLGSATPGVKIGGGGGVGIGSPAAVNTGPAGFTKLDYDFSKPVSNPVGTITVGSVFAGTIPDVVTTMDIAKPKKIGSLLS